jgi:hypothetical protein
VPNIKGYIRARETLVLREADRNLKDSQKNRNEDKKIYRKKCP